MNWLMNKTKIPKISFAITVCNEHIELDRLLNQLITNVIKPTDEIVIQIDQEKYTSSVEKVIKNHMKTCPNISYCKFPLAGDFASFKNNLKNKCVGDYIFQIDADETLGVFLWVIHDLLMENPNIDLFNICRINTVSDLPLDYIHEQGWKVTHTHTYEGLPIINWPDPQARIFKNKKSIMWKNKVHERIYGHKNFTLLSNGDYSDIEGNRRFSLIHQKSFAKQQQQNEFYKTIIE